MWGTGERQTVERGGAGVSCRAGISLPLFQGNKGKAGRRDIVCTTSMIPMEFVGGVLWKGADQLGYRMLGSHSFIKQLPKTKSLLQEAAGEYKRVTLKYYI